MTDFTYGPWVTPTDTYTAQCGLPSPNLFAGFLQEDSTGAKTQNLSPQSAASSLDVLDSAYWGRSWEAYLSLSRPQWPGPTPYRPDLAFDATILPTAVGYQLQATSYQFPDESPVALINSRCQQTDAGKTAWTEYLASSGAAAFTSWLNNSWSPIVSAGEFRCKLGPFFESQGTFTYTITVGSYSSSGYVIVPSGSSNFILPTSVSIPLTGITYHDLSPVNFNLPLHWVDVPSYGGPLLSLVMRLTDLNVPPGGAVLEPPAIKNGAHNNGTASAYGTAVQNVWRPVYLQAPVPLPPAPRLLTAGSGPRELYWE